MMKHFTRYLPIALLVTAMPVSGQSISLEQLLERAMQQNSQVQIARLDETKVGSQIDEVRANARPHVAVAGDYKRYIKIPGQLVPASFFGGPEGTYATLAFGLPYNMSTTLQASQALYNPSIGLGLKAAKLSQQVATLQTVKTKEDIAYQVSATYYNLQTVNQQLGFLKSNHTSLAKMIRITDLLYQQKLAKGTDVDRLRINMTGLETQMASLNAGKEQLINLLKLLTGMPQSDPLDIETTIQQNAAQPLNTEDATLNRTEIQLLQRQRELNDLSYKSTKAGNLPTVAAYGVANSTFFGKGGSDGVFKNVPGYWFGLQVNWSLYDGSARNARMRQNRIDSDKLNEQEKLLKESITMDVLNARAKLLVEQQNLRAVRDQVALAEKVYQQAQLQFKEGTISLTDVIQAENSVSESQNNYLTTFVKLRTAELDWKKATGTLVPQP
nr:TolC family protein [uncultured Arsenicibacter sp.]